MAAVVSNIAKGRVAELARRVQNNDPTNSALVVVLLKTAEANSALQDYATLAAMLAAGGGSSNVEADFTNYARKEVTSVTLDVDNTNDVSDVGFADQTYTSAGGASNNTLVKAIICYEPDTTSPSDSNKIPLTIHDMSATTDGNDLQVNLNAEGFYRAS